MLLLYQLKYSPPASPITTTINPAAGLLIEFLLALVILGINNPLSVLIISNAADGVNVGFDNDDPICTCFVAKSPYIKCLVLSPLINNLSLTFMSIINQLFILKT